MTFKSNPVSVHFNFLESEMILSSNTRPIRKNDDIDWGVKIKISFTKSSHLMYKIKENVKIKETVKYHLQFYCKTYF